MLQTQTRNPGVLAAIKEVNKIMNLGKNLRALYAAYMMEKRDKAAWEYTLRHEGLEQGCAEGRIQGCLQAYQETGISRADTQRKIQENFSLTENEAEEYFTKFWKS